ncbi:MAG: hypothetical protein ACLFSU_03055 [Acholeplasmataceae bacterium]
MKKKLKPRIKKRPIRRILMLIVYLLLFGAIYSFGFTTYEYFAVEREIRDFKERATFAYETEVETRPGTFQTRRYYTVPRETWYEREDERDVFYDEDKEFLGQKGDILTTRQSPFPHVRWFHPFMTYYYGGHAAIHDGKNGFIEATGFPQPDESLFEIMFHPGTEPHDYSVTVARNSRNNWLIKGFRGENDPQYPYYGTHYRTEGFALRVKGVTEEQVDGVVDYGNDVVDNDYIYNFLFFLMMEKRYYCTDLVSRAYQHVMVEEERQRNYSQALNDDGFITTVNDLILSNETYVTSFYEVIDGVAHVYYLEDL